MILVPAGMLPAAEPVPESAVSAASGERRRVGGVSAAPGAVRAAGAASVFRYQVRVTSSVVSAGS